VIAGLLIAALLGAGWGLYHSESHDAHATPADAGH
jgi:hypothetical protein